MSRVFIEFAVGEDQHRLDIQLFDNRCPKAVANFLYLLAAHEVPDNVISDREKSISDSLPAPLKATRVSRIDASNRKQIDFGVSGTSSVFGGCYDDENVGPTQQEQENLQKQNPGKALNQIVHPNFLHDFGTISVANCGPNTNGSKYFISLDRRQDIDGFHQIIGTVAPHSLQALQELANCKVNVKKGYIPEPAVKIYDCGIIRAANENGWKETALGVVSNNNNNNSQQHQPQQQSRLKMLKGRGSQLEKRMAQGDGEDLLNFEQQNNETATSFADLQGTLEAGELARRRAKKRRIEDAAAGAGAWVEPPEVAASNEGTATRAGVVSSDFQSSNNNNTNRNKMSFSQAFQQSGGNLDKANEIMNDANNNNQLSERNVFAIAARNNQFMQDVDLIAAELKAKNQRASNKQKNAQQGKHNNNSKQRKLRY